MIRVLIERWLIEGAETSVHDACRGIRQEAIKKPGYVSGETLRDVNDPSRYVVISSWHSREHWDAWVNSEERSRADEQFRAALAEPERITVLEPV
jgi:heme-degrading monooxygenase HmoA